MTAKWRDSSHGLCWVDNWCWEKSQANHQRFFFPSQQRRGILRVEERTAEATCPLIRCNSFAVWILAQLRPHTSSNAHTFEWQMLNMPAVFSRKWQWIFEESPPIFLYFPYFTMFPYFFYHVLLPTATLLSLLYQSAFNCCSLKTFSSSKVSLFASLILRFTLLLLLFSSLNIPTHTHMHRAGWCLYPNFSVNLSFYIFHREPLMV